jgi:hypothetical protein
MLFLLFFLTLLLPLNNAKPSKEAHPIYISLAIIDYNAEEKTLDITFKIFTDDLQDAIRNFTERQDLYIGYKDELPEVDESIDTYLNEVVSLRVNGNDTQKMQYLGKEIELDVTWCYLRVHEVAEPTDIEAYCSLLTELFPTQSTLMHVNKADEKKSLLFNARKKNNSIQF